MPNSVRAGRAPASAALVLALMSLPAAVSAQQPVRPDSLARDSTTAVELPALTVTVARSAEPLLRLPLAVSVVDRDAIAGARTTTGLDEALAGLPGVFVANRYNFSLDQRLSIRGFGSRANFGTRGVRILLDGVPQTLPDGQSQLTNVDFAQLDRIEVLRGAASSLYGNASGGVIAMRTISPGAAPVSQSVRLEGGAFDRFKWLSRTAARHGALAGTLTLSRFITGGFRQHGGADSRQLGASVEYTPSANTVATLRLALADQPRADNPGALTAAEYAERRDAAAENNLLRDAGKAVTQQQLALTVRHAADDGGEYGVTLFGLLRDLENPLATGTYVAIDRRVGGARIDATRRLGQGPAAPRLTAGADLQSMRDDRTNFAADAGRPTDSVEVDQREVVTEIGPFAQLRWTPVPRLMLSVGGRYDQLRFGVTDRHLSDGDDDSGARTLAAWSGHAGVSYALGERLVPYANVATAFETPTTTELANRPDGTGGFNDALGPQRAVSWEAGLRGDTGPLSYSVGLFTARVSDAIVQFREVGGRAYFTNAGRTRNRGIELGLSARPLPAVTFDAAYTYADYRFTDYRVRSEAAVDTLDGNRLPGVPRHFARLGLQLEPAPGWSLAIDHTLSSSVPADDANTIIVDDWGAGVTDLRVGWRGALGRVALAPFVGVNNLFDRAYVGSVTINGFGGRVLEPAPGRNLFVGLEAGITAER